MEWIEKIMQTRNLTEACYEVIRNKGAAGVDKMSVKELKAFLDENRTKLEELIRNHQYLPQPIRGKKLRQSRSLDRREKIPKRNKKMRLLGIPTVVDRMLQQAVSRVLMVHYEQIFSANSHGFIHIHNIFIGVHELAWPGSATTQRPSGTWKSIGIH